MGQIDLTLILLRLPKRYYNSTFQHSSFEPSTNMQGVNNLDKNGASLFHLDLNAVILIAT